MELAEATAQLDATLAAWAGVRAALVEVSCAPGRAEQVLATLHEHTPDAVVLRVEDAPGSLDRLRQLNRERDLALREHDAIVFVTTSGAESRLLRRHATDLTSVLDLHLRITDPARPLHDLIPDLNQALAVRHGTLDLTGFLPHTGDPVALDMGSVYLREAGLPREPHLLDRPTLLLAAPGSGKTTTLRFLSWQVASNDADRVLPSEVQVAVYAPLARWYAEARDREPPLRDFLERYLGELLGGGPVQLPSDLSGIAFLLDGLDEVQEQTARRGLLAQAASLHRQGARVLVSARHHVADDLRKEELQRWVRVELQVPDEDARRELARRILTNRAATVGLDRKEAAHRQRRVLHALHNPELLDLARFPLLLTFLVVLADLGQGYLPPHRTELYRDLVEMLLQTWRRVRGASGRAPLNRADLLRVLAPLAWNLVLRGVGGLTREELLELLTEQERLREPDPGQARQAAERRLDRIVADTALLRTDGLYRFHHPTIGEYLASQAVLLDPTALKHLLEDPYRPELAQVVVFTLATVCDLDPRPDIERPLVDALVQRSVRRGRYDSKIPLLLWQILRETRSLPTTSRLDLADGIFRITLTKALSEQARFLTMGLMLSLLRDPTLIPVASKWFSPPRSEIRWSDFARPLLSPPGPPGRPVTLQVTLAFLPESLAFVAGLDALPLLQAWLRHPDPAVRSLAWAPWLLQDPTRRELARRLDPEVEQRIPSLEEPVHGPFLDRLPAIRAVYGARQVDAILAELSTDQA